MSTVPSPPSPRAPSAAAPAAAGGPAPAPADESRYWLLRAAKAVVVLIYAVVLIDLVMLTLGFFLRLFGASTDAEFTRWVYRGVDRIMEPFRGMFPSHQVSGQSVLDVSLLFAIIVYAVAAIAFHALVVWLTAKVVALRDRRPVQPDPIGAPSPPERSYG